MSEPVFIVRNSVGAIVLDSRDAVAGACVDLVDVPAGTAPVYSYPDHVGRQALVMTVDGYTASGATVDTALGYPRVSFVSAARGRVASIFMI